MDAAVGNATERAAMSAIATSHAIASMGPTAATAAAAGENGPAAAVAAKLVPAKCDVREAQLRLKEAENLLSKFPRYRANDYAVEESDLRRSLILNTSESQFRADRVFSWLLSVVIGVLNGIAGFAFTQGINWLNRVKFGVTMSLISPGGPGIWPYLTYLAFTVAYAAAGAVLGSYLSPQAAGSGIPEIRCYLNGIHVRGLLTVRTFFAKSFGVVFSVASGLIVGKEGPFTHVGAILGGGVAHLGSTSLTRVTGGQLRAALHTRLGRYFKTAVSHRDYVAAGASAGVASAFAAPIGAILFSVEQGASFYNSNMLSHAFLSAGIAVYVSAVLEAALNQGSSLYRTAMTTKQTFVLLRAVPDNTRLWYYSWELPIFAVMGVIGGLLGAAMVVLNNAVTRLRRRFIPPTAPARRVAEVVALAALTGSTWFLAAYLSPCATYPPKHLFINNLGNVTGLGDPIVLYGGYYPQLWCPNGTYNEFGTLFFMPQMTTITMLFQYQLPSGASFIYNVGALVALFTLGWLFMSVTFGIGAVTGLFVPSLLVGGAGGRLMGRLVRTIMMRLGYQKDDGTGVINICLSAYAIVGAGSVMGGVSRMLLCNTVLVMETAAASTLIMPLIVTTFIAKAVADLLTPEGIFDLAISRAGYPYLAAELNQLTDVKMQHALTAGDVMSADLATLPAVLPVGQLVEALRRHPNFSTFPLTEPTASTAGAVPLTAPDAGSASSACLAGNGQGGGGAAAAAAAGTLTSTSIVPDPDPRPGTSADGDRSLFRARPPAQPETNGGSPDTAVKAGSAVTTGPPALTRGLPGVGPPGGAPAATASPQSPSLPECRERCPPAADAGAVFPSRTGIEDNTISGAGPAAPPPPQKAPSGPQALRRSSWRAFSIPHHLQPPGAVSFLSAFAGGALSAASALPAALHFEARRAVGRAVRPHRGTGGRGQGASSGPSRLASVSAPLPAASAAALGAGATVVEPAAVSGRQTAVADATEPPPLPSNTAPSGASAAAGGGGGGGLGVIIGTINRNVLLKLLEMQLEVGRTSSPDGLATLSFDAKGGAAAAPVAGPQWLSRHRAAMSRRRATRLMDALDNYPSKAPSSREGEEKIFGRLGPRELATYLDLRHYMQRVPYIVPATASLARTYSLFRGLGLHHIFVTAPNIPIIGLITRTDIAPAAAYKTAYQLAQREQEQLQALLTKAEEPGPGPGGAEPPPPPPPGAGGGAAVVAVAAVSDGKQQQPEEEGAEMEGRRAQQRPIYRAAFDRPQPPEPLQPQPSWPAGASPRPLESYDSLRQRGRWSLGGGEVGGGGAGKGVGGDADSSAARRTEDARGSSLMSPCEDSLGPMLPRPPASWAAGASSQQPLRLRPTGGGSILADPCPQQEPQAQHAGCSAGEAPGTDIRRGSLERRVRRLPLQVTSNRSEPDGGEEQPSAGGGAGPGGEDEYSGGGTSPVSLDGADAGRRTGAGVISRTGLRQRMRGRLRQAESPTETVVVAAAPPPLLPSQALPASSYGNAWPVAAPFSALVFGGGGGGVPRRATTPAAWGMEAVAASPSPPPLPSGADPQPAAHDAGATISMADVEAPEQFNSAFAEPRPQSLATARGDDTTPRWRTSTALPSAVRNMRPSAVASRADSDATPPPPPPQDAAAAAPASSDTDQWLPPLLLPQRLLQLLRRAPSSEDEASNGGERPAIQPPPAPLESTAAPPVEALVAGTFLLPPPHPPQEPPQQQPQLQPQLEPPR